jgi:hypothetical protein
MLSDVVRLLLLIALMTGPKPPWRPSRRGCPAHLSQLGVRPAGDHARLAAGHRRHPAACLGDEPRIWIVGSGRLKDPYRAIAANRAAVLRPRYRLSITRHFRGLTVFLVARNVRNGPAIAPVSSPGAGRGVMRTAWLLA